MTILTCEICGEEAVGEGDCPNEIMESSGYIQDDEDLSCWYCSKECKNYNKRIEILDSLKQKGL